MGINFQMSTYQKYFWMSPANSGLCSCFCTSPPHTSALLFCFSVLCLRVMERVLLKMLRSKFNLFILKAAAEVFCILAIRVSIPCGAAQCVFTVFFVPCCCCFCACLSIFFSHF